MAGPSPNKVSTSQLVGKFLKFAQTSVYRVRVQPPLGVQNFINNLGRGFDYGNEGADLELLCHEASLPGTSLATHDVTADFPGVTEKMAYRRIYDENLDSINALVKINVFKNKYSQEYFYISQNCKHI